MKKVEELDTAREKAGVELSHANHKSYETYEKIKEQENKISELRKICNEVKTNLQIQKDQYESVRTDRNLYSKNLVESQDEIAEMKRKFKIMYHQIEQLKEEVLGFVAWMYCRVVFRLIV